MINEKTESTKDMSDFDTLFELILKSDENEIKRHLCQTIDAIISAESMYHIVFLFKPNDSISEYDSDAIYRSMPDKGTKDILLIISSNGGRIEPAYFISKCLKEYSKDKFIVSIPRRAKSAATLIAIGSDEIHMGQLSELGPIDPQVGRAMLPALSLNSALDCLATLCKNHPEASDMLANYLSKTLQLSELGYLERISESAEHYAIRLLTNSKKFTAEQAKNIANKLVYSYKDHNFVIDKDESLQLLGDTIVKTNSREYFTGNNVYNFLNMANLILSVKRKTLNLVGSTENLQINDLPSNS